MKKQKKMTLLALFVVFTMFGSSFAFIIVGGFGSPSNRGQDPQGEQITAPTEFVVDGYISFQNANTFLQRGYTLLEFHRPEGCCPNFQATINALPSELDFQMVVQNIEDDDTFFAAESFRGRKDFNATTILDVIFELCDVLASPTPDCAFREVENTTPLSNDGGGFTAPPPTGTTQPMGGHSPQ